MSDCQLMGKWRFEPVTATGVHMFDRAAASAKALSHDIMLPDDGPYSCRRARMRCACGGSCLCVSPSSLHCLFVAVGPQFRHSLVEVRFHARFHVKQEQSA